MFYSPLRYPGGKRKLANFVKALFSSNDLLDGEYAEVYAGGAGVALALLYGEYVRRIYINDLDRGVHAFWDACLNHTDDLCGRIREADLNMDEWHRQKSIQDIADPEPLDLAFSTFYLNRTNRSGIITGGVIGGKEQAGEWKLDARFNKDDLIERIEKIGRHRGRIRLSKLDAASFLREVVPTLSERSLVYLDPPYFVKGQQMLYANYYQEADHAEIASLTASLERSWLITYDDVDEIRALYKDFRSVSYGISYSAQDRYRGKEIVFFSDDLIIPDVLDIASVNRRDLYELEEELAI